MGWTYLFDKPTNVGAFLLAQHTWRNEEAGRAYTGVACSIVRLSTAYLAVRIEDGAGSRVVAAVVKLNFNRSHGEPFGYKAMDEFAAPYERACPERILKLLTPLPPEPCGPPRAYPYGGSDSLWWRDTTLDPAAYAREWRADCWARIARMRTRPHLREGVRLRAKDAGGVRLWSRQLEQEIVVHELIARDRFLGRRKRPSYLLQAVGYTDLYYQPRDTLLAALEVCR